MQHHIPWEKSRMEFSPVNMRVSHIQKMHFIAENDKGIKIPVDAHKHLGGEGLIPNPIEYLMASLGGCIGIKILLALSDHEIIPGSLSIHIKGERKQSLPAIFDRVHIDIDIQASIDQKELSEIIEVIMYQLCPIAVIFSESCTLTWDTHPMYGAI